MHECRKCNLFHHVHSCPFLVLLPNEKVCKLPARVHIQSHHVGMRSHIRRNQCKARYLWPLRRVLSIGKSIVVVFDLPLLGLKLSFSGFRRNHSLFDLMITCVLRPWQESNLRTRLRKPMLYPLSYRGGVTTGRLRPLFTGHINEQHFLILFLKRVCKKKIIF